MSSSNAGPDPAPSAIPGLAERMAAYLPARLLPDPAGLPVSQRGAVAAARLAGFTALADSLARSGRDGADALTRIMSQVAATVHQTVSGDGGDLLNFDGQTWLAWFPDPVSGAAAIRRVLEATAAFHDIQTAGGPLKLRMEAGLATGELATLTLGSDRTGYNLAYSGEAVRSAYLAAEAAGWGELKEVVSETVQAALPVLKAGPGRAGLFGDEDPLSVYNRLAPYLPARLAQRLKSEPAAAAGEFRRVVNIFIQLPGLDLTEPAAVAALREYYSRVQQLCAELEGRVHQVLPLPQAGVVRLHLTFGAQATSFEDAHHAVRAVLALRDLPPPAPELPAFGVASGNVYTGSVGSRERLHYVLLGEVVDLSAHFAATALRLEPGAILVDRYTRERVGLAFLFDQDLTLNIPGRTTPVHASRLLSARPAAMSLARFTRNFPASEGALLEALAQFQAALAGRRQVCRLPEARLVAATAQSWLAKGGQGAVGLHRPGAAVVPFLAWGGLLGALSGWQDEDSPTEKAAKLAQAVARFAPDYTAYTGWLNQLTGLAQEEADFRLRLDGPQRTTFIRMVVEMLKEMARSAPLMLALLDLQYSDEAGLELLETALRELADAPLLVCLTVGEANKNGNGQREIARRIAALPGFER